MAITSGSAKIEGERPAGWFFDENDELALRITAEAPAATSLFIGVGPTAEVRRYLDGVAYDEVDDISFRPFSVDYDRRGPLEGRVPDGGLLLLLGLVLALFAARGAKTPPAPPAVPTPPPAPREEPERLPET